MRRTLLLTSPHLHGQVVRDCQYLLEHNRFGSFHPGHIDGVYGETTAAAVRRAKYSLGYSKRFINGKFGPVLYAYLHDGKRLTPAMRMRRKLRLAAMARQSTVKSRALAVGLAEARKRVVESPAGSNSNPYGRWFGFNRVPWCAIFVSYCFAHAGDKHSLRTALAYQWEYWARARAHGLSITHTPEPGDIVVYHHGQGHTGIFSRWTSRLGTFEAVEGNTSSGGSQDNGGAVLVQRRTLGAPMYPVFVRVGA